MSQPPLPGKKCEGDVSIRFGFRGGGGCDTGYLSYTIHEYNNVATPYYPIFVQLIVHWSLTKQSKIWHRALKVVVVVYERWLLTRGYKYSDLTWKFLYFGKRVTKERWSLKAAKYEIQKPSTCRATLFRCKFWSMFPVFHLAWSTWPVTKTLCCRLKKVVAKSSARAYLSNKFWLCFSFFIKLTACRATNLLVP